MKIIAVLSVVATIVCVCGCSPAGGPSDSTQDRNGLALSEHKSMRDQMYPILKYARDQSSDVLMKHEATENEKSLFRKMDSAVVALADDAEIERCYEVIIPIGREAGLDEEGSIAFWTRMTFSEFEP